MLVYQEYRFFDKTFFAVGRMGQLSRENNKANINVALRLQMKCFRSAFYIAKKKTLPPFSVLKNMPLFL